MARWKNFIFTNSVKLSKLYSMVLELWESVQAKHFVPLFFARYYFDALVDSMQKRSYRGAHGRLRVIKLEQIDSRRV